MSVMTVIKKIGEKVISIVEWPIKHSVQVAELLGTAIEDEPEVKTAIVGLVQQFEAIGADTAADIAANGLNLASDVKTVADVQVLFKYFTSTFIPAIEKAFSDFQVDVSGTPATAAPTAPAATTDATTTDAGTASTDTPQLQPGPGLHTIAAA